MLELDEKTNEYETEEDQRSDDVEWGNLTLYLLLAIAVFLMVRSIEWL